MKYSRFEDLPVWNSSQDLALAIYALTENRSFRQPGDLIDQLRRASLSISSNIAEGFERGTTPELLMFLYIARGSAGETRSLLRFASRLPSLADLKSQVSDLIPLPESCSRQLQGWMNSLQNSTIKGQRHLNDQAREAFTAKRRADAFREKLNAMNAHLLKPKQEE